MIEKNNLRKIIVNNQVHYNYMIEKENPLSLQNYQIKKFE